MCSTSAIRQNYSSIRIKFRILARSVPKLASAISCSLCDPVSGDDGRFIAESLEIDRSDELVEVVEEI